jgi:hypothetical protein
VGKMVESLKSSSTLRYECNHEVPVKKLAEVE